MDEPLSRPAELLIDQIDALRVLRADTDEENVHLERHNFAVYAIILLVLSWIVIPLAIWLAITA
jgi:hypothetical protein